MKNFISRKRKAALLAAVAVGTCFSFNHAAAMDEKIISWDDKEIFKIQYYGADDAGNTGTFFDDLGTDPLCWTLDEHLQGGMNRSFSLWAEIIGPGSNISQPAQYFVGTISDQNAFASAFSYKNGEKYENPNLFHEIFLNAQNVQQFTNASQIPTDESTLSQYENIAYGKIGIGQHIGYDDYTSTYGWSGWDIPLSPVTPLVRSINISAVTFHEVAHSLGVAAPIYNILLAGENGPGFSAAVFHAGENSAGFAPGSDDDYFPLGFYSAATIDENSFMAHLHNQDGVKAPTENGVVVPSEELADFFRFIIKESDDPELNTLGTDFFNFFYVEDVDSPSERAGKTYLYFVGDNVTEVMNGKTFTRGDGTQVTGIPVNLWENYNPDFSHIELARSVMSHQNFRSYFNFMEAELAILQDIGYNIDRRNFYGRSIYNDGLTITNTQGFSKRENGAYVDGYNSSTLGVGLHVYGSNNNITQAANIYTDGDGGVGIRVDGLNDKITVAEGTEIHADGENGVGVLMAYGRNHELDINGTVTANGDSGSALYFSFGHNTMGGATELRGSYIRYLRDVDENGNLSAAKNLGLSTLRDGSNDDYSFTDLVNGDLNAPLVDTVNINGTIEAKTNPFLNNAIYISNEAFVKNININEGAKVNGSILSFWKVFYPDYGTFDEETTLDNGTVGEPLYIQYNGGNYVYTEYIPDLVTNLNINTSLDYNYTILGQENMKINFNAGTFNFGDVAYSLNATVAKGAKVFGGAFQVDDVTSKLADGFSDDTTGKFYNHGTIGNLIIKGNLISDGVLTENIVVSGTANVDGSTISTINPLPDTTMDILTATSISGNIANTSTQRISGMLNGTAQINGNKITLTTETVNNIGELNAEQTENFNAVKNMSIALTNDDRKSELSPLYSLDSEDAGRALSQIGKSDAAQSLSVVQQSTVANRVISDRLVTAFSMNTVNFNVGGNNFADGENNGVVMAVSADYPADVYNNFWVKFTKNWGELKGGANYHGQAISGGYDRAVGPNTRVGTFITYNATGLGATTSGGNIYDTRGGLYFGYHKDTDDAFLYFDAGKVRNNLKRAIPALGLGAESKFSGKIFEFGGEYKKNLTPEKSWNVSPFINLQYSYLNQNAYSETGAGVYNQHVKAKSNNYFAGHLGVEFKRVLNRGNYAARIGVKHAFTGADPELNFSYEGDGNNFYTLKNNQDETYFIISLGGECNFKGGWKLGGDVGFQKGSHDKDVTASVMLRKVW